MNVLWLGPYRKSLDDFLRAQKDSALFYEAPLTAASHELDGRDFLVSYGYRHLVPAEVLSHYRGKAVNLHISLLPWNRGADPNLWSFLDDTPKGVSIHQMSEKLDAGDLLVQRALDFSGETTLRTSYEALSHAIEELFRESWPAIRSGRQASRPQGPGGSFHRQQDAEPYRALLTAGWDTPVRELTGRAKCRA